LEKTDIKKNIKDKSNWTRLVFMVLFVVAYTVAEIVFFTLVVFQFLSKVLSGSLNENVSKFSVSLIAYIKQILEYLSYASQTRPYPFSDWPSSK
jgi:hypothetical protein